EEVGEINSCSIGVLSIEAVRNLGVEGLRSHPEREPSSPLEIGCCGLNAGFETSSMSMTALPSLSRCFGKTVSSSTISGAIFFCCSVLPTTLPFSSSLPYQTTPSSSSSPLELSSLLPSLNRCRHSTHRL